MLHMFLEIFQRTILCSRRCCQAVDQKVPQNIKAPEELQRLKEKLQQALQNKVTTSNIVEQKELVLQGATDVYEALNSELIKVHTKWL